MKKLLKTILVISLFSLSVSLIVGCTKEEVPETPKIENNNTETTENNNQDNENTSDVSEEKPVEKLEKLAVSIGNDIGKDIVKLFIRPNNDDDWMEITLSDNPWRSGYLIPIELEAKTIPVPEYGWFLLVEFSDGSEQEFNGILLNSQDSVILTADGPIY